MAKKNTSLRQKKFSSNHLLLTAIVFGLVGGLVGWAAFAAPASPGPASISIATLNGQQYTSSMTPAYKDTVQFNTSIPKLPGYEYPMVALSCYQDVNGDGTIDTTLGGPDIVYSWLDTPKTVFSFSGQGQSSIWSNRGGGPAKCRADLDAYGWKGGKEIVQVLATTGDFAVSG